MIHRRGLLIHPHELSEDWLYEMHALGLNVLGLHPPGGPGAADALERMLSDIRGDTMRRLLSLAHTYGLEVEYEMHALSYLLPRSRFASHPNWFRMNEAGKRTADFNLCPSNDHAMEYLARRAAELAVLLPSTTHRYSFWLDDAMNSSCRCPACRTLTPSDQQLLCVNAILRGIRTVDPQATIAYIAYLDTLEPPQHVRPEPGVFLEYAPIRRRLDVPLADPDCAQNAHECAPLPALIDFFGIKDAQVLEYWMDNSLFSGWKYPPISFTLNADVMRADIAYYHSLGFESITSFACYLGADYTTLYSKPDLRPYGEALQLL